MRFKYLFTLVILLILACSISAISAEEGTIGDYSFTVPEGFEITNQTDYNTTLENSEANESIVLIIPRQYTDTHEEIKTILESQGYVLRDETDYPIGDFDVTQFEFYYTYHHGYFYICENGDDIILITHDYLNEENMPEFDGDYDVQDIIYFLK